MSRQYGTAYEIKSFSKLSVDAYADALIWSCPDFVTKFLTFSAVDKDVVVTTYYSRDGGITWTAKDSDFNIAIDTPVVKTYGDVYSHIKATVKSKATGKAGTLTCVCFGTAVATPV
jgi:hypothetical protein